MTTHYPRSPWETRGNLYFLPGSIDKMRAFLTGTVDPYYSHTGLSVRVFDVFRTDAVTFEEIVRTNGTDAGILAAITELHAPSAEEFAAVNVRLSWSPDGNPNW